MRFAPFVVSAQRTTRCVRASNRARCYAYAVTNVAVLTDEQRAFRAVVRRYAEEQVAPGAAANDREQRFPREAVAAGHDLGLHALHIPAKYGGSGADAVTVALAIEEVSRVCASTALCFAVTGLATTPILSPWATKDQQARYLSKVANDNWIGSYALSEADAGSDAGAK